MELGFRSSSGGATMYVLPESLMITGSLVIVDVQAVVQYNIKDPDAFVSRVADPEGCPDGRTLRDAARAALSEVVGQHTIDDVLVRKRGEVETDTHQKLQKILDSYNTGINVIGVLLVDVKAPQEVLDAFHDVLRARQEGDTMENQALAYRNDIIPRSQGEAERILIDAGAARDARIIQAEGDIKRFVSVLREYEKEEAPTFKDLHLRALDSILPGISEFILAAEPVANRPFDSSFGSDLLPKRAFESRPAKQTVLVSYDHGIIGSSGQTTGLPSFNPQTSLDNRLLRIDARPEVMPDKEKLNLIIDSYARYRIIDSVRFRETLGTEPVARSRSANIINSMLRAQIALRTRSEVIGAEFILDESGNHVLDEDRQPLVIGTHTREEIIRQVLAEVQRIVADQNFGIEVVDVRIKQVSFPEEVIHSIHTRMRAERNRIASRFRAEGEEAALRIRAEADKDRTIILAEAGRQADAIVAEGEAGAIDIYIEAIAQFPELSRYQKSLEAYQVSGIVGR